MSFAPNRALDLAIRSYRDDADLFNKKTGEWVEKWLTADVEIYTTELPRNHIIRGKADASAKFQGLIHKVDNYNYVFQDAYVNEKDPNSVCILGEIRFSKRGQLDRVLKVIDKVRFNLDQEQIKDITMFMDFGGWEDM
jgi:hypothetical protein